MLRFRIQELLADHQFRTGRRVTLTELAGSTGISRVTLSKMINQRGYGTLTQHLDSLCGFFGCRIEQLAEYVPDSDTPSVSGRVRNTPLAGQKRKPKAGRRDG
jgi:DNA-binding Xre family transcriptional regulator